MKKNQIKTLDALWSKLVKEDYKRKCIICKKPHRMLNTHHFVGRRNRSTRWYYPNGIPLCPSHHTFGLQSAHQHPSWFQKEMLLVWGDKWLEDLEEQSLKVCKASFEEVKAYLKGETDNYC